MRFFTTLLVLVVTLPAISQITIGSLTVAVPGDSLTRMNAPGGDIEIPLPGADQNWDWVIEEGVPVDVKFDTNDLVDLFPFADVKMTSGITNFYFVVDESQWNLVGQTGLDPLEFGFNVASFYQPPQQQEYAPLIYQDSLVQQFEVLTGIPLSFIPDSLLENLPVRPDSLRAVVQTVQLDDVDGWGVLRINSGSSIDVLKQRREIQISVAIEAMIGLPFWIDVTDLLINYFDALPVEINLRDTFVSHRFLTPGFGLPVAEAFVDSNTVTRIEYQEDPLSNVIQPRQAVFSQLTVFPNPTSDYLFMDGMEEVQRIMVFDLNGRAVLVTQDIPGSSGLDVSSLAAGSYLVTVWGESGLSAMARFQVVH